ncbi:MAG: hypothetical protein Q7R54_02115 [bacterium]|nr:hypothetical protein [bacterium]
MELKTFISKLLAREEGDTGVSESCKMAPDPPIPTLLVLLEKTEKFGVQNVPALRNKLAEIDRADQRRSNRLKAFAQICGLNLKNALKEYEAEVKQGAPIKALETLQRAFDRYAFGLDQPLILPDINSTRKEAVRVTSLHAK